MTDAFTPERIAQLREILAEAPTLPWFAQEGFNTLYRMTNGDSGTTVAIAKFGENDQVSYEEASAAIKAATHAVNTLPAALDEIELLRDCLKSVADLHDATLADYEVVRAKLASVKAELEDAVRLLRSTVAPMAAYPETGPNAGEVHKRADRIEAFLSRMEGRKDG